MANAEVKERGQPQAPRATNLADRECPVLASDELVHQEILCLAHEIRASKPIVIDREIVDPIYWSAVRSKMKQGELARGFVTEAGTGDLYWVEVLVEHQDSIGGVVFALLRKHKCTPATMEVGRSLPPRYRLDRDRKTNLWRVWRKNPDGTETILVEDCATAQIATERTFEHATYQQQ